MSLERELQKLYHKNFPEAPSAIDLEINKKLFVKKLSPYINNLLNNDFAKLLQIMYRIDVPEKEFALTLRIDKPENRPDEEIASLIFDRLLLKAKIRAKYKDGNA